MDTVRALVADRSAPGHVALREAPAPTPAASEAVVAVEAVSLNRGEVRALQHAADGWRPGWDLAGVVVAAAADGSGPPAGTRVVGLAVSGAWAERVAVPTDVLARLPEAVDAGAAATLPVAGLTALRAVELDTVENHTVLVTGASGGVGRFAIQLAAQLGADVTALVSSPERGRAAARPRCRHRRGRRARGRHLRRRPGVGRRRRPRHHAPVDQHRRSHRELRQLVGGADDVRRHRLLPPWRRPPLRLRTAQRAVPQRVRRRSTWPGWRAWWPTATSTWGSPTTSHRTAASAVIESFLRREITGKAVLRITA